ncbi:O-fucosyltransferase 23 [Castilleja foliolosa]|uniref:O-fucosyltransferase family protein n=1 Tax=Castilleja foliolosa TaxID=1961234 RepID=A0ABD3CPR7_9LAMI
MELKQFRVIRPYLNSLVSKCAFLIIIALILRAICLSRFSAIEQSNLFNRPTWSPKPESLKTKFLEVPQIIWGLNNQKIALARACLTAKMMNRTLLMPSLSASLFYKEVDLLKPISFDKVFQFEKFNSLCNGVVQLARYSEVFNITNVFELQKGSGRKWTVDKDLMQLRQKNLYDGYEIVRVVGKNPFLWHDHWPVKDYAKVFECLVLVEEISREASKVVSKIREIGSNINSKLKHVPYAAVHMRIEKDWMIHCKKLEQRLNVSEICSSKEQIMERVGNIFGLKTPIVVYLAVADDLLEDDSIMAGWADGLVPFEKKKLGVLGIYEKHPYLIRSAIDYEVCLRSDVFVGNSFSTFSSLVVLDRTQKMVTMGDKKRCGIEDVRWPSYAYNTEGESKGSPRPWGANMSDLSLRAISYGSNHISCR